MARWQLSVDLGTDGEGGVPLFARIARAVSDDIARGRLVAGQRLPGTRSLADSLGVHRNTVVAAFDELGAQGWVATHPARGTFVAGVPDPSHRARAARLPAGSVTREPAFSLRGEAPPDPGAAEPPGALVLAGGRPDARLFPSEIVGRAYRRALRLHGREVLDYGEAWGEKTLRAAIASMLA